MKKSIIALLISFSSFISFAMHTKGGWMYYEYLGAGVNDPTKFRYKIVLNLYMICTPSSGQLDQQINFSFFDAGTNQYIQDISVPLSDNPNIQNCTLVECHPCVSNIPDICYKIATYETIQELSPSLNGYTISYQRCCRISNIINITNSGAVGDTWTITIPGTKNLLTAPQNSSPKFVVNDTALICAENYFTFNFTATDPDGDSLAYSFAPAYLGGDNGANIAPDPAASPPYISVPYSTPFSSFQPLGSGVSIDPASGVVSGLAPPSGIYVVTVVAREYRNGIYIGEARKSLHIQVADCIPTRATLITPLPNCDNYTFSFSNATPSSNINSYFWNFGATAKDTSNSPSPTFTYADTGTYVVTLIVNSGEPCVDTAKITVKVYPKFYPGFITQGQCKNTAIQFTDTSHTNYGTVTSWSWNFGDSLSINDSAQIKNPQHVYSAPGNYNVNLIVTNSKGCSDNVTQTITITDKPSLQVTDDTLICSIDTLQLNAIGNGSFLWTPNYNINSQTSAAPLVSPKSPTTYYVTLTDQSGCKANDSVFVNVKQFVTVDAGPDQSICQGDSLQIPTQSDALHYKWIPSAFLNSDTTKSPIAFPSATTEFYVIANIGKCQSTDSVKIRVTPLPLSTLQVDTTICLGDIIQLHANGGSIYSWSPSFFLNNSTIPDPIANPSRSIRYIVMVNDTLGCAKPVFDTIVVQVQKIIADAGPRDTSVVVNQPLQLNATGGQFYLWSPTIYLSDATIPNPVAIFNTPGLYNYVVKASSANGCFGTDTISLKVYKVIPGIYLPNAFTPNGDGLNDVFVPVAIGMKQINYFKIFNRWGQLVFSTTQQNKGWDGTYNGSPQSSGVFVWLVEGLDYQNNKITQKGTVILIR